MNRASEIVFEAFVRGTCALLIIDAALSIGQDCLDDPSLVVAGTIGIIAAKELTPYVAPITTNAAASVIAVTQNYPKTTALTASYLCSKALPLAMTGEPVNIAVAGVACSLSAATLLAYLNDRNS